MCVCVHTHTHTHTHIRKNTGELGRLDFFMLFFTEEETESQGGKASKVIGSFIHSLTQQPLVEHMLPAGLHTAVNDTHTPYSWEPGF